MLKGQRRDKPKLFGQRGMMNLETGMTFLLMLSPLYLRLPHPRLHLPHLPLHHLHQVTMIPPMKMNEKSTLRWLTFYGKPP